VVDLNALSAAVITQIDASGQVNIGGGLVS
jgi:hypothetical protein